MMRPTKNIRSNVHKSAIIAVTLSAISMFAPSVFALDLQSLQIPDQPLVLKARGSFYVGGESIELTPTELGGPGPADAIVVNQMYVEYMIPAGEQKIPVIMIHGAGLSGMSYDTTPDGRMGWFEYFVRKSHPAYVVDQVGRARSGFDSAQLNRRLKGHSNGSDNPVVFRFGTRNGVWTNFRFGPRFGESFPGSQYPTEAVGELAKQAIPDMRAFVPTPNPTFKSLATLALELKGAVLISHSQSGHFPMESVLVDPAGIRGIVALEPGTCGNELFSDQQIAKLAKVPTLILFGDNLPTPTGFSSTTWQDRFDSCSKYVSRIKNAGGRAELVQTTSLGVQGNSHMLMQDRNNRQIADFLLKWIDSNAAVGNTLSQNTSSAQDSLNEEKGKIWRKGSQPITVGSSKNFTGAVKVQSPYQGTGGSHLRGSTVTFQPGARTAWHSHPMGQALIVTEGCGWTQAEGGSIHKICTGDVVWIGPGEKHWHGATSTTAMTHVTASEIVEGQNVEWLEKVSDEEYARGPR